MRSLLFVPANRPDRFAKAAGSGADALVIDLEDAVPPAGKDDGRRAAMTYLADRRRDATPPCLVRINGLGTRAGLDDLAAMADTTTAPDGLVLPKTRSARDISIVRGLFPDESLPLVAVVETADGIGRAEEIATAVGEDGAIAFGGADLAAELGCELAWEPMLPIRMRLVLAAAAAGVAFFDVPFLDVRDDVGLGAECRRLREIGIAGKLAIHPGQIGTINAAFTPSPEQVTAARAIIDAFSTAAGAACLVDGRMVDRPVYLSALRTIRRASPAPSLQGAHKDAV